MLKSNYQKPVTRDQLAELLGISRATLYRWLRKHNIEVPNGLICPKSQEKIAKVFGFEY